jgi:hypothetical protein
LIGSPGNDRGGDNAGKVYLILGKKSNFLMDINLTYSTASFIGERSDDWAGLSVSGAGDVNGDGYDDFLIGAPGEPGIMDRTGEVYLIFGKSTNWANNILLSQSDASFIGEDYDRFGHSISGCGDVNGDGFDDFIIGAPLNDYSYSDAGQAYVVFGKNSGWDLNTDISKADASFVGEEVQNIIGLAVSGAGDVNGDEYDDIILGSRWNDEGGESAGQTYVIFGRETGWNLRTNLASADASYIGEEAQDNTGFRVSDAGDVNFDGYGDFLIGAHFDSDNGYDAGQVYLILGKGSGWNKDVSLSSADASFIGEYAKDRAGISIDGIGDFNADGYDDIIIGAYHNDENSNNAGQVYLIRGKDSDWEMDTYLSEADCSFLGEYKGDNIGYCISGAGDHDRDGFNDIILGSYLNDENGKDSGQIYIVKGIGHYEPKEVYSIKCYSDDSYTDEISESEIGNDIFIELIGLDGNVSSQDRAIINIISEPSSKKNFRISLDETGINTGHYHGRITLGINNDLPNRIFKTSIEDIINISSLKDPLKFCTINIVTPIGLKPLIDQREIIEDDDYYVNYWNFGYNEAIQWTFESNSVWIKWNENTHTLYGTPRNDDVGSCWVRINITDGAGHFDEHLFEILTINSIPTIQKVNDIKILEDQYFEIDMNSDDEDQGDTEWTISPANINWINLDPISGLISGIPDNDAVGIYNLNISVDDGNGGLNWTIFKLIVEDVNDPPIITTEPLTSILQEKQYYVQFNAFDEDDINTFEWSMITDASFLNINNQTGVVSGTPENNDIGSYFVNVSAMDLRGKITTLNYSLEVIDVNDSPTWDKIPSDTQIEQGKVFGFKVVAIDVDIEDTISYWISSQPYSDISIDENTGEISWIASLEGLIPNPNFVMNVEVSATDGKDTIIHSFTITVIPNPSPTSTILGPINGKRITSAGILLEWEGDDDGGEPLEYDIYMGTSQTEVSMLERSALWMEDVEGNSIHTGEVERGKTYYWTVIPKDIYSCGSCTNNVFSFSVNIPPTIQEFNIPLAKIGIEFRLNLVGSDLNNDDLEFSLEFGPDGMDIFEGMISWIPAAGQVGAHTVNVSLSDGYETVYKEFVVTVAEEEIETEPEEKGSPIVLIIIIIIVILIIAVAGIGLFLYLKKKGEEEPSEDVADDNPPEDMVSNKEEKQAYEQLYGTE